MSTTPNPTRGDIAVLAAATRLISDRAHMIGIIECCLLSIRSKDELAPSITRHLSDADRDEVLRKLDAQDTRLADAIAGLAAAAPPPLPSAICHPVEAAPAPDSQLTPA
jgi:hypothetical protein